MFKSKPTPEPTSLEKAIEYIHLEMLMHDPNTPEYTAMADNLSKLYNLRAHDKHEKYRPSPDTLAIISGNILAVLIIVSYEQKHVIATKAMSFWQKLG